MKTDEEVRLIIVGNGRPGLVRHFDVRVARQQDCRSETALQRRTKTPREGEREIFLHDRLSASPGILATMSGVNNDNSDGPFRIVGIYTQNGQLYRVPNAAYTVGTFNFTAQVSEVKVTSQGIEGRWTAPVGAAFAGCIENAYFSQLFIS